MNLNQGPERQIEDAYRRLAEAGYRPSAPSDGYGNLTVPFEELDLDAEASHYAGQWLAQERSTIFRIGIPDYSTATAMVFTVEAARLMCGCSNGRPLALTLLSMATDELEQALDEAGRG